MKPGSPDRALEQEYTQAESALARIAHVNRLSRDIMDIKYYSMDVNVDNTLRIRSKKGIVDVVAPTPLGTSFNVFLRNPEIIADHDKFYIQLTVYSSNSAVTPIIIGRGISTDLFQLEIKNLDAAAAWGLLYFYFEIVKID